MDYCSADSLSLFSCSKISLFLSLQARKRVGVKKRREEVHSRRAQTEQSASQWLEERRSQELRRKTVGIRMGGRGDHVTLGGHVTGDDHMTLERATPPNCVASLWICRACSEERRGCYMYKSCEVYLCFWEEGGANYMYVVNVTPLPCSHWPLTHPH